MDGALLTLAVLACPVGMGVMMWFMMRGQSGKTDAGKTDAQPQASAHSNDEIAELRTEIEQLKAERAQRRSSAGEH